jgi:hypothetical protein
MTAQENQRFLAGIQKDHRKYHGMLGRVDAEASDCSRIEDRESIHEGIRRSVGFAKLSRMVFGVMEGWMEEQIRLQAVANVAAGNEATAMEWNTTLALVLYEQGRLDEAVAIIEAVLKFRQSVTPDDHVAIGVARLFL